MDHTDLVHTFRQRAELVSAVVHDALPLEQALASAVSLCRSTPDLEAGPPAPAAPPATPPPTPHDTAETRDTADPVTVTARTGGPSTARTLAAPELQGTELERLKLLCRDQGVELVSPPLRPHARGLTLGITHADFGIAETGTLVIRSSSEDKRLASMVCCIHVALLPVSRIRPSALTLAGELEEMMDVPHSYTAFVTGPSRTADIERVLALGVHGPLELHIMLLEA